VQERIILIGYRGTGKSTVGRLLAGQLGYDCLDADDEIEQAAGTPIRQIFEREGEEGFRRRESQVVADLCRRDRVVIATGGGAVLREANRAAIQSDGSLVVWLRATPETIYHRMHGDPTTAQRRPNLTAAGGMEEIVELLQRREPLYEATADLTIDTDGKPVEEIVTEIASQLA